MRKFEFKEPKLCKDKDNKKWFIRYSIKFEGETDFKPLKEYGRLYFSKSLNSIADLKLREKEFVRLLLLVERDLKAGILTKVPESLKVIDEMASKEAIRCSYDECLKKYYDSKGYINPVAKKEGTAATIESFHRTQFKPFLIKKGLDKDMAQVSKANIKEFLDSYDKWSHKTYNHKKGLLSTFFSFLIDEDIATENPAKKVKSKSKENTERFTVFTKVERDILFEYLDNWKYPFIAAICRVIYYSYIRGAEISRLRISDFNLETRKIRIHPDNAKSQKDNLVAFVVMPVQLKEALEVYLSKYERYEQDWYMFGKNFQPSKFRTGIDWVTNFKVAIGELKILHPGKFNRPGLTPYALKHSGVTHFVNDNSANYSSTKLYRYLQAQCRHTRFEQTQQYLKQLELSIDEVDEFEYS